MPINQNLTSLSEATAIRLYNSVVIVRGLIERTILNRVMRQNQQEVKEQNSIESVGSANEFGNSCRICRWNRSDMEVLKCPCQCKGSVGFIHLQCLKRWIIQRRDNHCEICNANFDMPEEKFSIRQMFSSFCSRCAGRVFKHIMLGFSLIPLAYIVLEQVLILMENINKSPHEQLKGSEVVMISSALLTSSALFFNFFEFITIRFFLIRNILRHWWILGNTDDFPLMEMESFFLDFFG